jgi:adenylate cyclase
MIESIDRHGGFINKFLGDGFTAIFGAPLDDPAAAHHAVAAAQ